MTTTLIRKAAFFNVGDLILYGKYKNKKGRIVGFTTDEKGQPVVEIEPVPKGQKQNKTLTLFKIRKAPAEKTASEVAARYQNYLWRTPSMTTAAVAAQVAIRHRVASRYVLAYAEREIKLTMKAYENLKKTAEKLIVVHTSYERARKGSKQKAQLAEDVKQQLEFSLKFAEITRDGIELFIRSYKPVTDYKAKNFEELKGQWNAWRRDPDAFIDSAHKYLAKGDPEGYFWPVNNVKEALNIFGTIVYAAFQLTAEDLKIPDVAENAPTQDMLREFAKGKPVGMARQVVKTLGGDKSKVFLFVHELLEEVNLGPVASSMKTPLKAWGSDEEAEKAADLIGRKISWNTEFAVGVAYAALKTVGEMALGEKLLAAAASYFEKFSK